MFYIIYKTTNLVNNKFYIGKHRQLIDPYEFDGYYGSGMQILRAIKKYGKANFIRETLYVFDNESACLLKEEEIVSQHLGKNYCYNMRSGGIGGFEHINSAPKEDRINIKAYKQKLENGEIKVGGTQHWTEESYKKVRESGWTKLRQRGIVKIINPWQGLTPDEKNKRASKIAAKIKGENNGSFGSKIYINPETNEKRRFMLNEQIPEGWVSSLEFTESRKKTHWYNDGVKNYLLKKNDPKIETFNLVRGRL